ncbi:hypothetical protein PIB30_014723 [Stylosanthes scabra]|uniref:GRF-type domain-containing protein n=1 Tax=Stylosanthes scabra TaxID=79078 RepID=A0ABU6W817_9FABA|nr:hypothetical protein [Stylosanthes scabra]
MRFLATEVRQAAAVSRCGGASVQRRFRGAVNGDLEGKGYGATEVKIDAPSHFRDCTRSSSKKLRSTHGRIPRRYVACGRMPKCTFFEWIDEDEGLKGECASSIQRRVRCFCGDSLTLRTFGTARNPNRKFISCPNRRCKFFEWVDKDDKLGAIKIQDASRQSSSALEAVNLRIRGTMEEHAIFQAQEEKMNKLRVDIERFNVEIRQ